MQITIAYTIIHVKNILNNIQDNILSIASFLYQI